MNATPVTLIVIAALASSFGCAKKAVVYQEREPAVVVTDKGSGPPAYAPAHGYRMKHANDGVELVYDADIHVYVLSGVDNCYYSAGQYFRCEARTWEWSASVDGPWKTVSHDSDLPPGLRHKHNKTRGHKKSGG